MAERKDIDNGIFDTKGDLLAGTGSDTFAVFPAGANGKVLAADSTKASGLDWITSPTPAGAVAKADYDANTILKADTDDTPVALTVPASTFLGRKASGSIAAMTVAEARALLGYEIAYAQLTSGVNVSSSTEATPTDVISLGSVTFDGTAVWIEFFCPSTTTGVGGLTGLILYLFDSTTNLCRIYRAQGNSALSVLPAGIVGRIRLTPSAGAHTYSVKGIFSGGTGPITLQAGSGSGGATTYAPIWMRAIAAA